jgi:hypothetical protein
MPREYEMELWEAADMLDETEEQICRRGEAGEIKMRRDRHGNVFCLVSEIEAISDRELEAARKEGEE